MSGPTDDNRPQPTRPDPGLTEAYPDVSYWEVLAVPAGILLVVVALLCLVASVVFG